MRIVILADVIDDQNAGIFVYADNLIKNLLKLDTMNEYWFIHSRPNPYFSGLNEIIVPKKSYTFYTLLRNLFILPRVISRLEPSVVHSLSHFPPWMFPWWRTKARKIVTIFDLTPILFGRTHLFISRISHKIFMPFVVRGSDYIITISESTKRDIIRTYSPVIPVVVTYLASRFGPTIDYHPTNPPYILHVGTIEPRKNLVFLVDVFDKLKAGGEFPYRLVLVGKNGWKNGDVIKRIKFSPYSADIIWLNDIAQDGLRDLYKGATVCVYPTIYEGFGLPPLEAMSLGCPVVVSDVSSLPEVVDGAGKLCKVNNLRDWVDALSQVITNEKLRNGMIQAGFVQAKKFSWLRCARETLQVYEL